MRLRAALCALLTSALPLRAQDASVMLGGSHVQYADSLDGTAGAVGARLVLGRGLRGASLDGAYSRFRDGGWAVQGAAQGTALWPVSGTALLGFAAGVGLNDYEGGLASGTGALGPMLSFRRPRAQLVMGASGGAFRTIDGVWSHIASGSLRGYWMPWRGVTLDAGVSGSLADSLRFMDVTAQVQFFVSRLRGSLLGGARAGDLADRPWGSAEVAWDVASPLTVEATVGRYPKDITGFSDGLYAQVGVRVHLLRRAHPLARPPGVVIEYVDGDRVRLLIRYAHRVETLRIAGDWNGWTPTAMTPRGHGQWTIEVTLPAGSYQYALLADGAWVLPDGVAGMDDGFGGRLARLFVGRS